MSANLVCMHLVVILTLGHDDEVAARFRPGPFPFYEKQQANIFHQDAEGQAKSGKGGLRIQSKRTCSWCFSNFLAKARCATSLFRK